MAKLSVRERLLKRKDDVLKIPVRLDGDTKVFVHELSSKKIEELRQLCRKGKEDKIDMEMLDALMLIEAVHEEDGSKSLTADLKLELGISNDVEFVNMAYRVGEKERIQQAIAEAMGFGDPDAEVGELKN